MIALHFDHAALHSASGAARRLELMGQLRDATQQAAEASNNLAAALAENTKAQAEVLAFAKSVAATENYQLTKGLADILSGQIAGHGVAGLALVPTGPVARY